MNRCRLIHSLCLLAFASLPGCSGDIPTEEGIIVKAKLLQGGRPIAVSSDVPGTGNMLDVVLVPDTGEGSLGEYYGEYSPDGSLVFPGPEQKGIPPGRYRLVVEGPETVPTGDAREKAESGPFQGAFTVDTTPFDFDIPAEKAGGEHHLGTIDLDEPPE